MIFHDYYTDIARPEIDRFVAAQELGRLVTVGADGTPHLGIYRPQINMVMSILHRLTGAALYVGTLLLAAWLIAAAMGERAFAVVSEVLAHPLGKLVLVGYSWALVHHMLGGMRHLLWDTGRGLQPRSADFSRG